MNKVILRNFQSPGDVVSLAYAVKALKEQYPQYQIDVRTSCQEIFQGNPYITQLNEKEKDVKVIDIGYPTIHKSNQNPYHFVNSFTHELGNQLSIKLEPTSWYSSIFIGRDEHHWYSAIYEKLQKDVPFICIASGYKKDFTIKQWSYKRWQQVVDNFPDITFVQIGLENSWHVQHKLKGNNVINLINKCDNRQLIRLIYNSAGVISYVSFPMMLGYAIPAHPRFNRKSRLLITLAGGREPSHWQMANNHHFLHSCGLLDCCDNGGCWRSRVIPLGDGDVQDQSLCFKPHQMEDGQWIAKCMEMISVDDVCSIVKKWKENLTWSGDWV